MWDSGPEWAFILWAMEKTFADFRCAHGPGRESDLIRTMLLKDYQLLSQVFVT